MKIIDALRSKDEGQPLANRLNDIRHRAADKLTHTRDLFPQFTDHTITHSEGVLDILDWLLPDQIKEQLNAWELYFLVAATYLHDIGMVESCPGTPKGRDWNTFLRAFKKRAENAERDASDIALRAKREYVRAHHHERSEEYIKQAWKELELRAADTPIEADIVGRIALGHRKVDLGDRTMFGEVPFGNNQLIRRDLLAAYLRLADELDTTAHRTPWAEFEILDLEDETSILEWGKHLALGGIASNQGVIQLAGRCHDHKVFLRLLRLENEIKAKLREMKGMLPRPYASGDCFKADDPLPYHDIVVKVEHVGYLPINIKFDLQHQEIARLIMGERLYGDKTACIRELLQNAVDTCREAGEVRPKSWKPRIQVVQEENTLTVTDNGMGMDEHIIREYFSKIGLSYYGSSDFHGKFKPISEFGIGILSCFMLADTIEVDTLREGSKPIHLEVQSLTEPFVPKEGTRTEPGTTITLHLKKELDEDLGKPLDAVERVHHFARHVELPIDVTTKDGGNERVEDQGLIPTQSELEEEFARTSAEVDSELSLYDSTESVVKSKGVHLGVTLVRAWAPSLHRARVETILMRIECLNKDSSWVSLKISSVLLAKVHGAN